jgi:PadR family transcriptional regulator, regulatory protein PadR
MIRDFFLGFIKIHILYHASNEPIYGTGIMEELERHGYHVSPGLIYPTLKALEKQGLLKSNKKVIQSRVRKYYTITKKGLKVLEESRKKITELVNEVLK